MYMLHERKKLTLAGFLKLRTSLCLEVNLFLNRFFLHPRWCLQGISHPSLGCQQDHAAAPLRAADQTRRQAVELFGPHSNNTVKNVF